MSARRGRPTLAQSAARDSAVLDAATQLFVDRGFADTTMDAVAARAATTKRSIYRRYPDKEALFMAVVEDMTTSFSDALFDEIDAGDSLEQGLELLALRLLDYMVSQSSLSLHRLVKTEAKRHVELARRVHDEIVVAAIADMAAALRKITAVHGGKLKESNAAAQLFFAVVTAECDTATEFGKPLPGRATCRATARRVARLFTGGLISAVPDQGGAGPVAKRSRRR